MIEEQTAEELAVQSPRTRERHPRRPRGRVTIFGTWCKGCGICIEFCPQSVFETNGQGRPVVAFPQKCTACHWCDTHCPDMAITVHRLEPEEEEELEQLSELAGQGALPGGNL